LNEVGCDDEPCEAWTLATAALPVNPMQPSVSSRAPKAFITFTLFPVQCKIGLNSSFMGIADGAFLYNPQNLWQE
jgi:hypothetical protein